MQQSTATGLGSLWIVLQANTYEEGKKRNRDMSVGTLRYQANAALAYGAEVLTWACWTKGWWENNAIDTAKVKAFDGNGAVEVTKRKDGSLAVLLKSCEGVLVESE